MTTVCVVGVAAGAVVLGSMLQKSNGPSATARRARRGFLLERRLDVFGMLEMRDERRTHLDQQCLELGAGGPGDERLVDRVEHRLVIGDLVVDVGLVELRSLQALELGDVLVAACLQALAGRIVGRRDLQLGGEVGGVPSLLVQ